jgi:hypothetical protein
VNEDFKTAIYEYIRSIEISDGSDRKQPRYPFDPSLERSLRILDHIHRQRETFEGIKIPAAPFRNKRINGSAQ